jgi:anti-sigma regulatory factor (Ser/Thr protein kinase)
MKVSRTMEEALRVPHLPSTVESERMHLRVPTRLDWIQPTVEYLTFKAILCGACQESRATKLTIALHEAINNSVIHGNLELSSALRATDDDAFARELAQRAANPDLNSRCVSIDVDYDGERIQWSITDEGQGFDVSKLLQRDPEAPSEILMASGRGILIMRTFLDELRYEQGGRQLILVLRRDSGDEKRRHARLPLEKRVRVTPIRPDGTVDWDVASEAMTKNFSQEGLAILQARLANTERILIGIDTEGQPLYVPVEVRHWRKIGEDMVELGCRFQTTPGAVKSKRPIQLLHHVEDAVGELIERQRAQQTVHDDRRSHPRVVFTGRVTVSSRSLPEPIHGFARDLSKSGLAFITTVPVQQEVVSLLLPDPSSGGLRVQAQVVRCVKIMEGYFDVGARFLSLTEN